MKKVRIGSGSAFWGDALEPAVELAEKGNLQYLGFDHLAELTMSILQRVKAKDPNGGFIPDIIPWSKKLLPITIENGVKMITNAGGANPSAAGDAVIKIAKDLRLKRIKVGVIFGDDILSKLDEIAAKGWKFKNLDTGDEDIDSVKDKIVAANVYIGAGKIIEALKEGADYIIAGRVSDNALYVGPLMYEFGWDYNDPYWDKIGSAITVGHLIECAGCVTGCMSCMWNKARDLWKAGYPIAEVDENGDAIITKVEGSGGIVNQWTVKEHLVYEVLDPSNYIMPDGIADFTTLKVDELGNDRVKVTNMSGKKRPDNLKVLIGYRDGFIAEGRIMMPWPNALEKIKKAEGDFRIRLERTKVKIRELQVDYIGINTLHGEAAPMPDKAFVEALNEVGLRIAAKTDTREEAEIIRREINILWGMGGVGTALAVPFPVRPVIAIWPTLIPREEVEEQLIIKEVE